MFGLSITEILVILVVALVVLGPEQLPQLARTIGRTLAEFRRTMDDLKYDITKLDDEAQPQQRSLRVEELGDANPAPNCERTPADSSSAPASEAKGPLPPEQTS